ncbi:MAG TPA: hypothetical protein DDZ41_09915, partial [Flavobacterium sp.]|nr:hypothetical protein [Flavobacterium sp.]
MYKIKSVIFILLCSISYAQNSTIKGRVVDENNEPLFGANIVWLNTNKGVISNEKGEFIIQKSNLSNSLFVS